jgi:flagellar motor switch protein FliN/FliY
MTSLHDLTVDAEPFVASFAALNLVVTPIDGAPSLQGPLTIVDFSPVGSTGFAPITVAIRADVPGELLDSIIAACATAAPDLAGSAPASIGSIAELPSDPGLAPSYQLISIGGDAIGTLVVRGDRRNEPAGAPTGAPSTAAAAGFSPPPTGSGSPRQAGSAANDLNMLRDVVLDVTVELGRESLTLAQMLELTIGSVVELDRAAGAPVDIRVNGILFGRGEVVVVDDEYAVRVVEIVDNQRHRS